jgi:hypothetical protein
MAIFGEDDRKWLMSYCVGCRQTTWHYDGLCSNREYHRSATAFTIVVSDAAQAAAQAAQTAQSERRVGHDEAVAEEC